MGRVSRRMRKGKKASLFQVRWIDSQFQHAIEYLSVGKVQDGIENYRALVQVKTPDWQVLTQPGSDADMDIDDVADLEVGDVYEEYEFPDEHATSMEEVEAIKNRRFDPTGHTEGPKDLIRVVLPRLAFVLNTNISLSILRARASLLIPLSTSGDKCCTRRTSTTLQRIFGRQVRSHSLS
ncbi:hypothetical protein PI125_g16274 [Phytophthora idaei]|nr:hypothetical protein PI125_g16274 [Phytophthora idaei]